MTLPASGDISLSDVKEEFETYGDTSLTDFYRGSLVADVSENNGVPTSGNISLTDLRGASGYLSLTSGKGTYSIYQMYGFNLDSAMAFGEVFGTKRSGLTTLNGDSVRSAFFMRSTGNYDFYLITYVGAGQLPNDLSLITQSGGGVITIGGASNISVNGLHRIYRWDMGSTLPIEWAEGNSPKLQFRTF